MWMHVHMCAVKENKAHAVVLAGREWGDTPIQCFVFTAPMTTPEGIKALRWAMKLMRHTRKTTSLTCRICHFCC